MIILSGGGSMVWSALCKRVDTYMVLPKPVGAATIIVKGCLKGTLVSAWIPGPSFNVPWLLKECPMAPIQCPMAPNEWPLAFNEGPLAPNDWSLASKEWPLAAKKGRVW